MQRSSLLQIHDDDFELDSVECSPAKHCHIVFS